MSGPQATMDLTARREADRRISQTRKDARRDFERYSKESADADFAYDLARSKAFAIAKAEGLSDRASDLRAREVGAEHKLKRDLAKSLARSALLRIEEAERDSVSVRDIHSTSERIDGLAA